MKPNLGLLTGLGASLVLAVIALAAGWPYAEWFGIVLSALLALRLWRDQREAERVRNSLVYALDAMQAGIVLYDADDRLVVTNADFRQLYAPIAKRLVPGLAFEDLLREAVRAGLVPEAQAAGDAWIDQRVAQHRDAGAGVAMLRRMADGRWRRITEQRLPDGSLLAFSIDVTELVESERALELARATLEDAIEALPEGFALYDAEDRLVVCNQRYRELYAASAPSMVAGARFVDILRYGLERGQYPQAAADPQAWLAERERRHRDPDGAPLLQELPDQRWLRIDERKTRAGGIAGVRTDVTEMVHARQQLERLSTTDALTGCGNRRLFDECLAQELRRALRHGQALALLMIDIDHFKRYNDRYGHPAGDAALARVASLLAQQARRPGELLARYGGEEFALLLPYNDEGMALALAERCRVALAKAAIEHGDSPTAPHLTLSIGVAVHRAGAGLAPEDAVTFTQRADAALYRAKQLGRARAVAAAPADDARPARLEPDEDQMQRAAAASPDAP